MASSKKRKIRTSAKGSCSSKTSKTKSQSSVLTLSNKTKNYFETLANNDTEKTVRTGCLIISDTTINNTTEPKTKKQTIKPVTVKVNELKFPYKMLKTILKKLKFPLVVQTIDSTHTLRKKIN